MSEQKNFGLWVFSLNDSDLPQFYTEQNCHTTIYDVLYIQNCGHDFPDETKEVLHLRDESILLIDTDLFPTYHRLCLNGYLFIITEEFCLLDEIKVLMRMFYYYRFPEIIIDMGRISEAQKECIRLLLAEYTNSQDNYQETMLRNLLVATALLSPKVHFETRIKSGHLLNYALQFTNLIEQYVPQEKKKNFYAERLGLTKKSLETMLRAVFHQSFREIMNHRILIDAVKLLIFSDKNISQIAYELDYDVSDFNKLFLKEEGMSPKDLRARFQKIIHSVENDYRYSTI